MGSIRRLDSNVDIQTFPGANFEAVGDIPQAQCSEAKIEGDNATTVDIPPALTDAGKFAGIDLTGKNCTIVSGIGVTPGVYAIASNTDNTLDLAVPCGDGTAVVYYVHDGGALILTRDVLSLADFIHAAGYAYTFKAGKLYTDMPNGQIKEACTILWDPLT